MMLTTAIGFMVAATLGGAALFTIKPAARSRSVVRLLHAGFGVLALVWILAGAHDVSIAGQGPLVGLIGFATASGGLLFRQRIREGAVQRTAVWIHTALGVTGLMLLVWSVVN